MIGHANEDSGLYYLTQNISSSPSCQAVIGSSPLSRQQQIMFLHSRFGHPSFEYLRHLFPSLFRQNDSFFYKVCQLAKHKCVHYPTHFYRASKPFALIQSDIWGSSCVKTLSNKRWFVSFIDNHFRVCWVYLIKDKFEISHIFELFHTMIKTQFDSNILAL